MHKEYDRFDPFSCEEYARISKFYGDRTADRSKVPLINHINEGLMYLLGMGADDVTLRAFCIHPLAQIAPFDPVDASDAEIIANEYASVAAMYLCRPDTDHIQTHDQARDLLLKKSSMPFNIGMMLMADKLQNQKDFRIYNSDHPRALQLERYFNIWIEFLRREFYF